MARNNRSNNNSGRKTVEEIARMGGQAEHSCRGFECQKEHGPKPGSMSPQEAGRLGGQAEHRCRGLECLKQEEDNQSNSKNRSRNRR